MRYTIFSLYRIYLRGLHGRRGEQNLPGGFSAVVPPDPMPNSEVKRRSADGSVGPPHARVGNCQASNRRTSPVRKCRAFSFACCLSVSALLRRDKSAGSGFARCAATARRAAGRTPAVAARHQIKQKAIRKDGLFALRQTNAGRHYICPAYKRYLTCLNDSVASTTPL